MNLYEKFMNTITLGGYFLWNIDDYLKKREEKFNEVKKNFDNVKKDYNKLIIEQKSINKILNLIKEKLNS